MSLQYDSDSIHQNTSKLPNDPEVTTLLQRFSIQQLQSIIKSTSGTMQICNGNKIRLIKEAYNLLTVFLALFFNCIKLSYISYIFIILIIITFVFPLFKIYFDGIYGRVSDFLMIRYTCL